MFNAYLSALLQISKTFPMNLYVGNLTNEINEQDLETLFSEFGRINNTKIIKDPETGMNKGFGFVEMDDKYQAMDAIDNLDRTYFKGQIIAVSEAKQKNASTQGGGRGRDGSRGRYDNNRSGGYGNRPNSGYHNDRSGSYNNDRQSGGYNNNRPSDGYRDQNNRTDKDSYNNRYSGGNRDYNKDDLSF